VKQHLISALAIARLTSLIAEDELTAPIREAIDRRAGAGPVQEKLAYLVTCSRCVSVWAAGGVLIAQQTRIGRPLVAALAGSQAALGVLTALDRLER
jgi:hypothetical protein